MIHSMTAYARQERQGDWGTLTWELRSINHRYVEISIRLPDELRALEPSVRDKVAARLKRGKIECNLRWRSADNATAAPLVINYEYLQQLAQACDDVAHTAGHGSAPSALDFMRWPGVLREPDADITPVVSAATALLDEALEDLIASRLREGDNIASWIESRCATIEDLVKQMRTQLPTLRERMRERINTKLQEFIANVDPGRLEQELAFLAQKTDVEEELDRLQSHVEEVRRVLQRDEAVGRRLDFLMQELNREANTLGSKSVDTETTRISVELKVQIEQIREQVQNAE